MWISHAKWPPLSPHTSDEKDYITTDEHQSEEQAIAVCQTLERDGYAGLGTVFPLKTWVTPKQQVKRRNANEQ